MEELQFRIDYVTDKGHERLQFRTYGETVEAIIAFIMDEGFSGSGDAYRFVDSHVWDVGSFVKSPPFNCKVTIQEPALPDDCQFEIARKFDGGIDLWEDVTGDWTDAELAVLAEKLQEKTVKYCNTFILDLYGYLVDTRDRMQEEEEGGEE